MTNGKGDTRRPEDGSAIAANWDRIFRKEPEREVRICSWCLEEINLPMSLETGVCFACREDDE